MTVNVYINNPLLVPVEGLLFQTAELMEACACCLNWCTSRLLPRALRFLDAPRGCSASPCFPPPLTILHLFLMSILHVLPLSALLLLLFISIGPVSWLAGLGKLFHIADVGRPLWFKPGWRQDLISKSGDKLPPQLSRQPLLFLFTPRESQTKTENPRQTQQFTVDEHTGVKGCRGPP